MPGIDDYILAIFGKLFQNSGPIPIDLESYEILIDQKTPDGHPFVDNGPPILLLGRPVEFVGAIQFGRIIESISNRFTGCSDLYKAADSFLHEAWKHHVEKIMASAAIEFGIRNRH
jgi:hypothetical protein